MSFGLSRGKQLVIEGVGIDLSELPSFEDARIDPRTWFDEPAKTLEIEVGCGKGTFLLQQAAVMPATNYVGIESVGEFFRYAADRMRRHQLTNVRILRADATEFIRYWCADEVASVFHIYFSDPWPKKRHHKRRVIQDQTLIDFHQVLGTGGEVRLVTDHDDLWAWYEEYATRHSQLFERRSFEIPESAENGEIVGSNFERKYRREGRPFHAMTLVKRSCQ